MIGAVAKRVWESLLWRLVQIVNWASTTHLRVLGYVAARDGRLSRFLHQPFPWRAPARRKSIIVARSGMLGDVLMCTPALRELKRLNPACRITFYTTCVELVDGLSYLDEVRYYSSARALPGLKWLCDRSWRFQLYYHPDLPRGAIRFWIEDSMPPARHIAELMADHLGIVVSDVRPDCVVDRDLVQGFREQWQGLPRPWIVINRCSSGYTPNKDWPTELWDRLVEKLVAEGTVIDIGVQSAGAVAQGAGSRINLVGKTNITELAAVIAAADVLISPSSAPIHIAAAVGTPTVVIYGGFEAPVGTAYPSQIGLSAAPRCSPCYLKTPCPIDRECLRQITPDVVESAVRRLWSHVGEQVLISERRLGSAIPEPD